MERLVRKSLKIRNYGGEPSTLPIVDVWLVNAEKKLCIKCNALFDTGASNFGITKDIAEALELNKEGSTEVCSSNGRYDADVYNSVLFSFDGNKYAELAPKTSNLPDGIDCIIGMNVISQGSSYCHQTRKTWR